MRDDKVKIRCPGCTRIFRELANNVRDGFQLNRQHCNRLLTLNGDAPFVRRALKTAKEIRATLQVMRTPADYSTDV
jgi:hypothetical protein